MNGENAAWLERRRKGIGGTDIAAILGMHPYKTALDVWLDKTGQAEPLVETPAMAIGKMLEGAVADMWWEQEGKAKYAVMVKPLLRELPWAADLGGAGSHALCTPDRVLCNAEPGAVAGLEVKTVGVRQAWRWGDEGTDTVPREYLLQCAWSMFVGGVDVWHLAALIGGQEFRVYTFERDIELERMMVDAAFRWWSTHMIGGAQPEVATASKSTDKWLDVRFPKTTGMELTVAQSTSTLEFLEQYRVVRSMQEHAAADMADMETLVKEMIGPHDGIVWPGGRITFKRPKDSKVTDWKSVAAALADRWRDETCNTDVDAAEHRERVDEIIAGCTTTRVNTRRFDARGMVRFTREELDRAKRAKLDELKGEAPNEPKSIEDHQDVS